MKSNKLTSFRDHLDKEYGKLGSKSRREYEEGFEAFKLGVFLQDLRAKEGMTQEELEKSAGFMWASTMKPRFDILRRFSFQNL